MKISGYSEFQQMRKLIQKEDDKKLSAKLPIDKPDAGSLPNDAVEISPISKLKMKLSSLPDIRENKILAVKNKITDGTLLTSESVKSGVEKLLSNILSNNL